MQVGKRVSTIKHRTSSQKMTTLQKNEGGRMSEVRYQNAS
jgi:hypothetical protein